MPVLEGMVKYILKKLMNVHCRPNVKFNLLERIIRLDALVGYFSSAFEIVSNPNAGRFLVLVFGAQKMERKTIADWNTQLRYAFAFSSTPWFKQCGFIRKNMPQAAFELNSDGRAAMPGNTRLFLKQQGIPVFEAVSLEMLKTYLTKTNIEQISTYYPVITASTSWKNNLPDAQEIILCFCASWQIIPYFLATFEDARAAFCLLEQAADRAVEKFLADIPVKRVVTVPGVDVPQRIDALLSRHGLTISPLAPAEIEELILEPAGERRAGTDARDAVEEDSKPQAVLLDAPSSRRLAVQLTSRFCIRCLRPGLSAQYLRLLGQRNMIWPDVTPPEELSQIVRETGATLWTARENILSRLFWRKACALPIFAEVAPVSSEDDYAGRLAELAARTDMESPEMLDRARVFRERLLRVHESIQSKTSVGRQGALPQAEDYLLAVWEGDGDNAGVNLAAFLEGVRKREQGRKILCLARANGEAVRPTGIFSLKLLFWCSFLEHPAEVDSLLPKAQAVHVYGSLIGFEALLMRRRVVVWSQEWYAGWGLTEDAVPVQRERKLNLDQLIALVFFASATYHAPWSGERLEPEEALALWHMRQRPDYERIFAGLQGTWALDPCYPVAEMRAAWFDVKAIDDSNEPLLRASLFGGVLADVLQFATTSPGFRRLLDTLPPMAAVDCFNIMVIQSYYLANYELLDFFVNEACRWFDEHPLPYDVILNFYTAYCDALKNNRFHDSEIPQYRDTGIENDYSEMIKYCEILIFSFEYEKLIKFITDNEIHSSIFYFKIIALLYDNARDMLKEKDIDLKKHTIMKILRKFLEERKFEGLEDFSKDFLHFFIACLMENRRRMKKSAAVLKHLVRSQNYLPPDANNIIFMVVQMLISNAEFLLAQDILRLLEGSEAAKSKTYQILSEKLKGSARCFSCAARLAAIESSLRKTERNVRDSASYRQWLVRSNNYALLRHYQTTTEIAAHGKTPQKPCGVIFVGYYGSFFTASLPVVINCLLRRGYAVYPIFNNHIALPEPWKTPFAKFAYALPDNRGPLHLRWEIDLPARRAVALGVNFYPRFFEIETMMLRRYDFDWRKPNVQRIFQFFLKQTDSALAWCRQLRKTVMGMPESPKIGIISQHSYQLPEAALADYVQAHCDGRLRFIQFKNLANMSLVHKQESVHTQLSAFDMGRYPDCRLIQLPARSRFEPWYTERKDDPAFCARLDAAREDLRVRSCEPCSGPLHDRIRAARSAGKRIVLCIGRFLFDQCLRREGGPGHADIRDWLEHTVSLAAAQPDILLIVRPHPHEDNPFISVKARQCLRDLLPQQLPDNIICMAPSAMSMQQMGALIDLAVIWVGTAANELTAMGVPVAACSYAAHDQMPYDAIFPQSREEYANLLRCTRFPSPDDEARKRAAACLEYISSSAALEEYPYAYLYQSNSFRIIPWYYPDRLQKYYEHGDPHIESIADQIVAGFERDEDAGAVGK